MNKEINRIRTQIDFNPTRGHVDASLIYTALMYYNRGGNTNMTASQLIAAAFKSYDASEAVDVTKILDTENRAKAFMRIYSIQSKEDIMEAVISREYETGNDLIEPDKKFVCFDGDDPDVVKLWETLSEVRFRDRGCQINAWLYQYFAHGLSEYYNSLCASRLLRWMQEEYELMKDISTEKLDKVIDCLWLNSLDPKELTKEEAAYRELDELELVNSEDLEGEDKLRALLGL